MTEVLLPIAGIIYPHLAAKHGPPSHGTGRRCEECDGKVNQYTEPQPITGRVLCNQHWSVPVGYQLSATGRAIKEAA